MEGTFQWFDKQDLIDYLKPLDADEFQDEQI